MGCVITGLEATSVIPPTFQELVSEADTIIDGEVKGLKTVEKALKDRPLLFTQVTLAVHEQLKGTPTEGKDYDLLIFGGLEKKETSIIVGAPAFAVGDRAVFFIHKNGKTAVPLVAIGLGHYWVAQDPKQNQLAVYQGNGAPLKGISDIDAAAALGSYSLGPQSSHPPNLTSDETPITLTSFKKSIRKQLNSR